MTACPETTQNTGMGANSFSVTVEALDVLGNRLEELGSKFAGMQSLVDTSRAQRASDSPISGGALATFGETMMEALQTTATLLREDRSKVVEIADRYRSVDEQAAQAAEGVGADLRNRMLPDVSLGQSDVTRGILNGISVVDDAVVPTARAVTGASDWIQESLRSGARNARNGANETARTIDRVDPVAAEGIRVIGEVTADVLSAADRALESAEDAVRGIADWAEDLSSRADRVLVRPTAGAR
jgi:hypothetical protein